MNDAFRGIVNQLYDFGQKQLKKRLDDPNDPLDDERAERIYKVTELGQRVFNVFLDDDPNNIEQLEKIFDQLLDAGVNVDTLGN